MTKTLKNKLLVVLVALFVALTCVFSVTATTALAEATDHSLCANNSEYCLVCDVAAKVNALPEAEDITIDNAAKVMQQINDIDRIKFDLSDEQYDEFEALVETSGYGNVVKYNNAVDKILQLNDGAEFYVTKEFLGFDDADLSEAEVSFEITNVETQATQTLTLFDLGAEVSAFGADFYTKDSNGWSYTYKLPAGTYTIKEINQDKPITVNGNEQIFTCAEMSCGTTTETGAVAVDGITVTLAAGEAATVYATNTTGTLEIESLPNYIDYTTITGLYFNGGYSGSKVAEFRYAGAETTDDTADDKYVGLYQANTDYYFMDRDNPHAKVCIDIEYFCGNHKKIRTYEEVDFTYLEIAKGSKAEFGYYFAENTNLKTVTFPKGFVNGEASIPRMFEGCSSLTSVTFDSWNMSPSSSETSFNISGMFYGCSNLEEVNFIDCTIGGDKSSYLKEMFNGCAKLKTVDLSIFKTNASPNTDAFTGCEALETIYVPWKTGVYGVTLPGTFYAADGKAYTTSLPQANTSTGVVAVYKADTAPVAYIEEYTDWGTSFAQYLEDSLTVEYIYVNGLPSGYSIADKDYSITNGTNTIKPTQDISADYSVLPVYLYQLDNKAYVVNGGAFKQYVNTKNAGYLFASNPNIDEGENTFCNAVEIDLTKLDTSESTAFNSMFRYAKKLEKITFGDKFLTSNATKMQSMFAGCLSLKSVDLSQFETSNVTSMNYMFSNCDSLTEIDISTFDTSNVTDFMGMFRHYNEPDVDPKESSANIIIGSGFDTSKGTWLHQMFQGYVVTEDNCENFQKIVSAMVVTNTDYYYNTIFFAIDFSKAPDDFTLDISHWDITKIINDTENPTWTQGTYTDHLLFYGDDVPRLKINEQEAGVFLNLGVNESATGWTRVEDKAYFADNNAIATASEAGTYEWHVCEYNNGFCNCGGYEEAHQNPEGYYQITNGGNLFWFAELVNGGTYDAKAIVTATTIDLEGNNGRVFPGIGGRTTNTAYTGHFNGNGATIENLYIENDADTSENVGFVNFAIGAKVENFTVKGSIVITKLISNVAGVIGQVGDGTTVTGVNSYVNITTTHGGDNGDTAGTYYAGIIGFVTGGNVVIEKCAYYGTINTGASVCTTGGIAGHAGWNKNTLIKDSAFYGTIINIRAKSIIGGIVAYANTQGNIKIQNCLVVGTFEHNEKVDGVDLTAFGTHNSALSELTNSYYRTNSTILKVVKHETNEVDYGVTATKVTDEQLASGEVAWLLNGGNETENAVWKQTIDTHDYPYFVGEPVYQYKDGGCSDGTFTYAYSNADEEDVITHCTGGGYKYAATDNESGKISVYCADCGEVLQTITITLPDYLGYTGDNKEITYDVETLVPGYDLTHSVTFTYLYSETKTGYFTAVDAVNAAGFYFAEMTVSPAAATFAFEDAAESATATSEMFEVTDTTVIFNYYDYDGTLIDSVTGIIPQGGANVTPEQPKWTIPSNSYYTYTFKYWYCETNDTKYTTFPDFNQFFNSGVYEVDFKAVYNVTYNKGFHLQGSIDGQTGLSTSGIYQNGENVKIVSNNESVTVYVNYAITKNDGVAALLLIPKYDSRFTISAVSVNGDNTLFGTGATSSAILSGWEVTVTGGTDWDTFKILLENLEEDSAVNTYTGDLFIQIVYTMDKDDVESGEYNFGFVTKYQDDTYDNSTDSDLSHNDRSEAYGVVTGSSVASFNELKISVTDANIIIVKRTNTTIEMNTDSVIYDAAAAEIYEDSKITDVINVFVYHYGGCGTTLADGTAHDWTKYITIKWYSDADGKNLLDAAPINAGTYYVGISAAQNDYFNAVAEKIFEVTITPYTIDVNAEKLNDKTYNGADQTWEESDFTITDVEGKTALNSEQGYNLEITDATYKNAGTYTVTLTFTATENYTFDGVAGDKKVFELEVVMNKFELTVTPSDQEAEYSGSEPTVDQNQYTLSPNDAFISADIKAGRLTITIVKVLGVDAGTYEITVTVAEGKESDVDLDNYDVTTTTETFTITRKVIDVPQNITLTYNGVEQFPTSDSDAYGYTGDKQINVGDYTLTATLVSNNYVWVDYVNTNNADTLKRELVWNIVAVEITVDIGSYSSVYSEKLATIEGKVISGELQSNDSLSDLVTYTIENAQYSNDGNNYLLVGTYTITGTDKSENYVITFENGSYEVTQKALELEEILALITGATKEYTGNGLTWSLDTEGDFVLDTSLVGVIRITKVDAVTGTEYKNANGKLVDNAWTYYDPETKLYYTATFELIDTANYTLPETSGNVEVFIKQATNDWTVGPEVTVTDIENFDAIADAKFKAEGEVTIVLKDAEGNVVTKDQLIAGKDYTATFTVVETNNYTGLVEVLDVKLGFAYISLPNVYLDVENGTVVDPNGQLEITYDGVAHKFVIVPTGEGKYTITVNTDDDYASWKDAGDEYYITISLTDNYSWTGDDRENKTYTLVINKASLTLTAGITAENNTITYRDSITYKVTPNKFVNDETYDTYEKGLNILSYVTSEYVAGTTGAGTYENYITFNENAETKIEAILTNYDVILENGTLTVEKLALDLSELKGQLDSETEQLWASLVANGLTVEYNAATHSVKVSGYPKELVPTITYNGGADLPKNAGKYTVTVVFDTAEEYDANNFTWMDPDDVTLEITKVAITVTAGAQKTAYTGEAIEASALTFNGDTTSWKYTGNATNTAFITETDLFKLTGFTLNDSYIDVDTYANAIRVFTALQKVLLITIQLPTKTVRLLSKRKI